VRLYLSVGVLLVAASQMDLTDRICGKLVDVPIRVVTHIVRANHDIADIAQKLTAGPAHNLCEKEIG
jgi:phage tail protein X